MVKSSIKHLTNVKECSSVMLLLTPEKNHHWDNNNGTIERGYAGMSLWKWYELPERIDPRYIDYARANASIGINGTVINNVNASAPGLTKGSKVGQYNWNVTNVAGNKAMLTVTGKLPDGTNVSDKKEFIIRDIPRPAATIRGELERMKGSKSDLKVSTIGVAFPDFVFNVNVSVVSFEIKCPGITTIIVQGNKINDAAAKAIDKTTKGDVIAISQIATKLEGAGNYRMPPSGSFLWEVQ
jgi:hypothetical protein